ncbi:MAG: DUF2497 domain-containing protein [Rhodospirillales bacterium]|jgi:cell pole-organizing protein PopZ
MSDKNPEQQKVSDGAVQDPSMEDILASIRRILSEETDDQPGDKVVKAAGPEQADDVFELTPSMMIGDNEPDEGVVSTPIKQVSAEVLNQLSKAILDRQEMMVSRQGVPLEGMIREMLRPMLRPMLREWLDRNLPHLIERLVKREIDDMVNRAEWRND